MTASPAVRVERWDVFARGPGSGNPCYLVRRTQVAGRARFRLRETVRLTRR